MEVLYLKIHNIRAYKYKNIVVEANLYHIQWSYYESITAVWAKKNYNLAQEKRKICLSRHCLHLYTKPNLLGALATTYKILNFRSTAFVIIEMAYAALNGYSETARKHQDHQNTHTIQTKTRSNMWKSCSDQLGEMLELLRKLDGDPSSDIY